MSRNNEDSFFFNLSEMSLVEEYKSLKMLDMKLKFFFAF